MLLSVEKQCFEYAFSQSSPGFPPQPHSVEVRTYVWTHPTYGRAGGRTDGNGITFPAKQRNPTELA